MGPDTSTASFNRAVKPQLVSSCAFFVFCTTAGMSVGHSAVLLPELKSTNSSIRIDEDMESWIASAYAIAGPLGCILGGFSVDVWGRKKLSILGSMVLLLGWLLIVSAQNYSTIIVGRILEGLTRNEVATSMTVLADEVSDPKFRGPVIAGAVTFYSVGIITISCLGAFLHWRTASGVASLIALVSLISVLFVCESPMWLIRKKKNKRAEIVLRYLWGPGKESQVKRELADLKVRLRLEDVAETPTIYQKISSYFKLILEPHVLKPFLIIHFFNVIQVFCGLNLFTYYSIDILTRMGNGIKIINENVINIIISILRTVTVFFTCFLIFLIGRRKLSITSGIFSFVFALCLGVMLFARNVRELPLINEYADSCITFILIIMFVISMSLGFAIFPALMIGETQALCIRGFACGYIYAMNELVLGGVLKMYPSLIKTLQIHGLFLMFAASCLVCTVFVYIFLPETKGLTLQEIEEYFRQPNILWITRKTSVKFGNAFEETGDDSESIVLRKYHQSCSNGVQEQIKASQSNVQNH